MHIGIRKVQSWGGGNELVARSSLMNRQNFDDELSESLLIPAKISLNHLGWGGSASSSAYTPHPAS